MCRNASSLNTFYLQSLERMLKRQFPSVEFVTKRIQPVTLLKSQVELQIPRNVEGYSIVPDREPCVVSTMMLYVGSHMYKTHCFADFEEGC